MLQRCSGSAVLAIVVMLTAAACTSSQPAPAAPAAPAAAEGTAAAAPAAAPAGDEAAADEDHETHTITTSVEGSGAERWLVTTVTPAPGYKCNMEYPRWQVQVDESAPAAAGARATRENASVFEESGVTIRVPITDATAAGELTGKVRFSVCNDEACLMPTENVAWTLAAAQ